MTRDTLKWGEVFARAGAPVVAERYTVESAVASHGHDFMEVVVILGGEGRHRSFTGEADLRRGSALVVRPGAWHAYEACRGLRLINCCFPASLLARELAWCADHPPLERLLWSGPLDVRRRGILPLTADMDACESALTPLLQPKTGPAGRIGALLRLLDILSSAGPEAGAIDADVARCVVLLEGRMSHPWTLGELADEVALDPSHLSRKFRRAAGLPPMAYLAHMRAGAAAQLLAQTDLPVGEVGERVGWSDPNYFARRFRAHLGCTARDYRARFKP